MLLNFEIKGQKLHMENFCCQFEILQVCMTRKQSGSYQTQIMYYTDQRRCWLCGHMKGSDTSKTKCASVFFHCLPKAAGSSLPPPVQTVVFLCL